MPDQVEEIPVQEVHTTKVKIQEIPVQEEPIRIPEETKYTESIKLDHAPKQQQVVEVQPMQPQPGPVQFEIQIGRPSTTTQTTTSVVTTETTTYTQITSDLIDEQVPVIKEGDERHKTVVTIDKEDKIQPMELKVQLPEQQVSDVITQTHEIITKELKTTPIMSDVQPSETHKETIEIVQDQGPEEVEFQVVLPTKEATRTEVTKTETHKTTVEERRQSVQKMEVEIKESYMKTKPQQVELDVPVVKEVSTSDIQVRGFRESPRPTDEIVEMTRPTLERDVKEEIVVEKTPKDEYPQIEMEIEMPTQDMTTTKLVETTETTEETTHVEEIVFDVKGKPKQPEEVTFHLQPEKITEEDTSKVEFEVDIQAPTAEKPVPIQPSEADVTTEEKIPLMPEAEAEAPMQEIHVSERDTVEVIREPDNVEAVQIDIDIGDALPEVTTVTETEKVTETVKEEFTFRLPEADELQREEIILDIKEKPMDEEAVDTSA